MVRAYLRERLRLRLFVPLALVIAAAARETGWELLPAAGFALLLLVQFRVWDDLADRHHDAIEHPERVLVRAPEVTPVIGLCGALAVLNLCLAVWRDGSGIAVGLLALLDLGFGWFYLARAGSKDHSVGGDCLLLAKYPLILLVVAGAGITTAPLQIGGAAVTLYAGVCVYEAWHDPRGPLARHLTLGGH